MVPKRRGGVSSVELAATRKEAGPRLTAGIGIDNNIMFRNASEL